MNNSPDLLHSNDQDLHFASGRNPATVGKANLSKVRLTSGSHNLDSKSPEIALGNLPGQWQDTRVDRN